MPLFTLTEHVTGQQLLEGKLPDLVLNEADKSSETEVVKAVMAMLADEFGGSIDFGIHTWLPNRKERERRAKMMAMESRKTSGALTEKAMPVLTQDFMSLKVYKNSGGPGNNGKTGKVTLSKPKRMGKAKNTKKVLPVYKKTVEALAQVFGLKVEEIEALVASEGTKEMPMEMPMEMPAKPQIKIKAVKKPTKKSGRSKKS